MSLILGIVGLLAAIVMLATKIIELKLAVIKYRKENPQPTTTTTLTTTQPLPPKKKRSFSGIWDAIVDLLALVVSYLVVLILYFSKGPVTKQDLGLIGMAVVLWLAAISMRAKP